MEVTGKNQDECMVALHDSNEDVNRAINFLLEGTSDTVRGETDRVRQFGRMEKVGVGWGRGSSKSCQCFQ